MNKRQAIELIQGISQGHVSFLRKEMSNLSDMPGFESLFIDTAAAMTTATVKAMTLPDQNPRDTIRGILDD